MPQNANPPEPPSSASAIVAIGASAGDTASLQRLLGRLEPRGDTAVVVVLQHREALDEDAFRAAVADQGRELTIIVHDSIVEPGRVYLPASNELVEVDGGRFRAAPARGRPGERGTIDTLLVSMARSEDGGGVAVLLHGTGGDGTLGVTAIKEAGGLTLAERPPGDEERDLATSSSPAAIADFLLPADELADRVAAYLRERHEAPKPDPEQVTAALRGIAGILRGQTGHDFHGYKQGTFLRRVQRRMQVLGVDTLPAYVEALRAHPDEAQHLFNDLLIGVTQFFRDKREWELIERDVVPALFQGKTAADGLRVWVIGCSTGEEAYSLAILLREHMTRMDAAPHVQIFATDIDGRALATARAGRYTEGIAAEMSPGRLARWFVKEGRTYCVVKELREMCIFSQHSIIKDAPFSRLDLVSCRNLLIYLDAELQSRVIPLFHFALKPGGFLFLGNSENVSRHATLFAPVENRHRIFRRLETSTRVLPDLPFTAIDHRIAERAARAPPQRPTVAGGLARRAERVAERYAPAHVIVDDAYDVLHFSGKTGRYIDPAVGAASLNLLALAHPDLRLDLRAALQVAGEKNRAVQVSGLRMGANGSAGLVDLVVEPVEDEASATRGFVVVFKDGVIAPDGDADAPGGSGRDARVERLERELRDANERLQAAVEELESTNEELKSSNEEYQSLNEELQSANEELETSKEELQSVNEELTTVNGELAHRVHELGRANSDVKNLLESTQIATIFLDNELRVMNYTPAVAEIFHLVETDIGRPLAHIKSRVRYDELADDVRRVLRTLGSVDREVESEQGTRYMVRVLPYRSTDNFIGGAVVTFVDTTPVSRAEQALRASEQRFRALATAGSAMTYSMSPDWRVMTRLNGRDLLTDTVEPSADWPEMYFYPEDRPAIMAAIERAVRDKSLFELEHRVRGLKGEVWVVSRAVPVLDAEGAVTEWFGAANDVTDRRAAFEALAASELRLRTLIEGVPQLVWRSSDKGLWTWASPQWLSFTGQTQEQVLGRGWMDAVHPDDRDRVLQAWDAAAQDGMLDVEYRIRRASDGAYLWHHTRSLPVRDEAGRMLEWLGTCTDVQQLKELQERQAVLVAELQHRTRNLIGVVRSVSDKTLAGSASLDEFAATFRDRLGALARVQGLLSRLNEGERVTFDELIGTELAAHGVPDGGGGQVVVDGPKGVRLRSATVQTLALALHELATNASKYGALVQPSARLDVRWTVMDDDRLRVEWRESGVAMRPEGRTAPRQGYGRELIERALPYQLGASTTYDLTEDGVRCTIEIPLKRG